MRNRQLAPASGLSMRKASLLSLTLMPMSGVALILVHDTTALFPGLGSALCKRSEPQTAPGPGVTHDGRRDVLER